MLLDKRVCDRARRARDARFDGRFFIAVTTTRIYCRPICPARSPKDENVRYYPTAAAAEAAGFRPCLRCRPEASPGTPGWSGTSAIVSRALRLIGDGALDEDGCEALADRLGVTDRHLRRLFLEHLGATPLDVALTRRVHFAKKLLDETTLSIGDVAFAAGFGSVRRFNSQMRRTFTRTPTELRRLARRREPDASESYWFRLAFRPPYDWDGVISFLRARATPGVEAVDDTGYRRTIALDGLHGVVTIGHDAGAALRLGVRFPDPRALLTIVERVRRMFDLGADPAVIAEQLKSDAMLRPLVTRTPGIRTPGAWDGFELAVRAILGQQVSVRAATTIAGRIAAMCGTAIAGGEGLDRLFPTAAQLANADVEAAGVMPARAETIRALARRVASGTIAIAGSPDTSSLIAALTALPGIGPWTAEYIAMRVLNEPDAMPTGDLVLRQKTGARTARELERRSDAWRPWRAYAVMLLWTGEPERTQGATSPGGTHDHERSARAPRAQRGLHPLGPAFRRQAVRRDPR
jgi:AraC family transcriptional regulator of adaptative response / DNA-3-methyladenine glycosylase II